MPTRPFRGLKSPLRLFGNRWLAFIKSNLRWQASFMIPLMVRGSAATCYCPSRKKIKGSARITDAPLVRETDTCRDGLVVINRHVTRYWRAPASRLGGSGATDEHHTNCNTRSPRRFRSCRNRGLPCGNQSEPSALRKQALSDSQSPYQPKSVPLRVPWRR